MSRVKTNFEEYYNNDNINKKIRKRIEDAIKWSKKHNVKIYENEFQKFLDYLINDLNKVENLVNSINKRGYLWTSNLPMFFFSELDDIENNNIDIGEVEIFKIPAKLKYYYTFVAGEPYREISDRYLLVLMDEEYGRIEEDITGNETLMELLEKGVTMTENYILGLSYNDVKKFIENL